MVFDLEVFPYLDKLHDVLPLRDDTDRTPVPCPPVPPISTQEWLKLDPDDMAYYWTPGGDVHFSDEMNAWMAGLALELDGIHVTLSPQEFLKTLFQNIAGCDKKSFFREAFYDFIAHQTDPPVPGGAGPAGPPGPAGGAEPPPVCGHSGQPRPAKKSVRFLSIKQPRRRKSARLLTL